MTISQRADYKWKVTKLLIEHLFDREILAAEDKFAGLHLMIPD